jgi:hypothetical protein
MFYYVFGDYMRKTLIWIILAIISGSLLGKYTFDKYKKIDIDNILKSDKNIYALKYKMYSNTNEMYEDISDIDRYIYIQNNDVITVYLAIAKNKENITKLKSIYDNKNVKTIISKIKIVNNDFINDLDEYERLLSVTSDSKTLLTIENQILSSFEKKVVINE